MRLIKALIRKILILFGYRRLFAPHYYSAEGEDAIMKVFLWEKLYTGGTKGFYVDIGAYHPITISNTYLFYEQGWRGINIDASPGSMALFEKYRKRDINIEAGVSDEAGKLEYYFFGTTGNTFDKALAEDHKNAGEEVKEIIPVNVYPLNYLLEKYLPEGQHIDFISIDVEGFEERILNAFDFGKYAPDYFCVEELEFAGEERDIGKLTESPVHSLLGKNNYIAVAKTIRTVIYRRLPG